MSPATARMAGSDRAAEVAQARAAGHIAVRRRRANCARSTSAAVQPEFCGSEQSKNHQQQAAERQRGNGFGRGCGRVGCLAGEGEQAQVGTVAGRYVI